MRQHDRLTLIASNFSRNSSFTNRGHSTTNPLTNSGNDRPLIASSSPLPVEWSWPWNSTTSAPHAPTACARRRRRSCVTRSSAPRTRARGHCIAASYLVRIISVSVASFGSDMGVRVSSEHFTQSTDGFVNLAGVRPCLCATPPPRVPVPKPSCEVGTRDKREGRRVSVTDRLPHRAIAPGARQDP